MYATLTRCQAPQNSAQSLRRPLRPGADIYETPDAWLLLLDVPGADEHATDIAVEKQVLTIKADVEESVSEGFERVHTEFLPRRFERSFRLPDQIDTAAIEATVRNGVLRVTLPKTKEARPHQVQVKAG